MNVYIVKLIISIVDYIAHFYCRITFSKFHNDNFVHVIDQIKVSIVYSCELGIAIFAWSVIF